MKEDIDDEIKSLGRVLKKQEDKFVGIDNSISMILTQINTEPTDSLIKDIQINVAQMKEQLEIKVKQLSDAL
jgi:riboflavin synthase